MKKWFFVWPAIAFILTAALSNFQESRPSQLSRHHLLNRQKNSATGVGYLLSDEVNPPKPAHVEIPTPREPLNPAQHRPATLKLTEVMARAQRR